MRQHSYFAVTHCENMEVKIAINNHRSSGFRSKSLIVYLRQCCFVWFKIVGPHSSGNFCCIFEMKHASGLETCTKNYFLFIFNLV